MSVARIVALLFAGTVLASCSSISGFVADYWPHWAGGLPKDAPPRPGTPQYDAYRKQLDIAGETQLPAATPESPKPHSATSPSAPRTIGGSAIY